MNCPHDKAQFNPEIEEELEGTAKLRAKITK